MIPMTNDTLTTAELVLLAEYCGHEIDKEVTCVVAIVNQKNPAWGRRWKPDVDANQRDEVVEAILKGGHTFSLLQTGGWCCFITKPVSCPKCGGGHCDEEFEAEGNTQGDAVCLAVLKVIGGKDEDRQ